MTDEDILKPGDEIRVIAPSYYEEPEDEPRNKLSIQHLEGLGFKVTFGKHLDENYHLGTATADHRVADLHDAISDKNVKLIMAYSGGWSANELLPKINWDLLKANPKPLIGYSDITVLLNAIYAKTGQVGYLGPDFGFFGKTKSLQYTVESFKEVFMQAHPVELKPSQTWKVLQNGDAEGVLLGGNLNTFHLLQGTEYQPQFDKPFILAVEDDDESGKLTARYFSRRVESILQLPNVRQNLRGVIIGRFLPASEFSTSDLAEVIKSKQLGDTPVMAEVDFGHNTPMLVLPIGGTVRMSTSDSTLTIV